MVTISFSEDMHIVPSLSMIQNGTVTIEEQDLPVFNVEVMPGDDSDPNKLAFEWIVEEMTERLVMIQLVFTEAVYVSAN